MASLDSLPADQRAVLQLVLQRDRTYDQIATMLSIDRAGVRQRALAALDALGPQTGVPAERRATITDYLLGQLPERVSEATRVRLGETPTERAWARVVASELSSIASHPLPEIPLESARYESRDRGSGEEPQRPPRSRRRRGERSGSAWTRQPRRSREPEHDEATDEAPPEAITTTASRETPPGGGGPERKSSRLGGAVLLAGLAIVVIIVAIVLIAGSGGSSKHSTSSTTSASTSTPAASTGSSTTPHVVHQINLTSPTQSKTAGLADVLKQGNANGIAIVAQNVVPNTKHDAYAVWLYNSPTDNHILGYVNPGVGSNGRLSTAGGLPSNASHYKELIVTLETQSNPKTPGKIILQGPLTLG